MKESLEYFLHDKIPATHLLGFTVKSLDNNKLVLEAPLKINHNDKGTGFGGSIESLAIITGWSVTWILLERSNIKANVVIKGSQSHFKAPVKGDFQAICDLPSNDEIKSLWETFTCKGKAKLSLHVKVQSEGSHCMELNAEYVFMKP